MLGGGRIVSAKRPLILADAKPTRYGRLTKPRVWHTRPDAAKTVPQGTGRQPPLGVSGRRPYAQTSTLRPAGKTPLVLFFNPIVRLATNRGFQPLGPDPRPQTPGPNAALSLGQSYKDFYVAGV
jgi:hypothetical protein